MLRSLVLASSLLFVGIGCGLLKFDLDQDIPAQTIQGSPLGSLLPASLFAIPLTIDVDGSAKARGAGVATSAYLKALGFTVTMPAGDNFDFLDSVSIKLSAPGQTEKVIATLSPVPKGSTTIQLSPAPNVDLLPYLKAGPTMTASAGGHLPPHDVTFDGKLTITIKI
jgi:hypothetical protein